MPKNEETANLVEADEDKPQVTADESVETDGFGVAKVEPKRRAEASRNETPRRVSLALPKQASKVSKGGMEPKLEGKRDQKGGLFCHMQSFM